jgi:hypothetical protein
MQIQSILSTTGPFLESKTRGQQLFVLTSLCFE